MSGPWARQPLATGMPKRSIREIRVAAANSVFWYHVIGIILRMSHVLGLRSPYDKIGRLVYFGRMLDKIRLHAMGQLPPDYQTNVGDALPKFNDRRCCRF